jgi:hypothetical protein
VGKVIEVFAMFEILTYMLILFALAAATPVLLVLIYGVLMLFPSARRIMAEPAAAHADDAA